MVGVGRLRSVRCTNRYTSPRLPVDSALFVGNRSSAQHTEQSCQQFHNPDIKSHSRLTLSAWCITLPKAPRTCVAVTSFRAFTTSHHETCCGDWAAPKRPKK